MLGFKDHFIITKESLAQRPLELFLLTTRGELATTPVNQFYFTRDYKYGKLVEPHINELSLCDLKPREEWQRISSGTNHVSFDLMGGSIMTILYSPPSPTH
uniref:Uncharacterized protein n=1 Tax=Picea glauca TaxID=3330 RepID=A0A101LTX4_PICGL|nr:hypothetical protein ABT39_MTgene3514 [Picea glauca]